MNELMALVEKAVRELNLSEEEREVLIQILIERSGKNKRIMIQFSSPKVKKALEYIEDNKTT